MPGSWILARSLASAATVVLDGQEARAAAHGLRLPCDGTAEPTALVAPDGGLVAVATCRDGRWKYHFVVAGVSDRLDSDGLGGHEHRDRTTAGRDRNTQRRHHRVFDRVHRGHRHLIGVARARPTNAVCR